MSESLKPCPFCGGKASLNYECGCKFDWSEIDETD